MGTGRPPDRSPYWLLRRTTPLADDAERLCAEWQVPLAVQWLRDQRDRYRF